MNTRISQQRLESYLWGAATLLRGTIDASDYKQFIFPLLFYKRLCDVYDEETKTALDESAGDKEFAAYPENHRFQIPPEAHWNETRTVAKNVGKALQNALRIIETANPEKLYGIFGDAQWTNKDRLSDTMLRNLIEHFSSLELTLVNLPEDELGNGYEYLVKKFADDAGHTAAEFYTNRTVVHLMTELLQPEPSESIYDPTCGSGGMLLSCIAHLRRQGSEWRNVRLFGQERNLMTSSIARMNCFLHGIEDFSIERGDTLDEPKFVQGDHLKQFDVVLANPPYSIKQWDREAFASDPWGRNIFGTPPQGRADYAFWQHIIKSMSPQTGRCAILFPHGVLFRQEEAEMRRKLIEADLIEGVIGLGPNLFYNSPMEACVVICRIIKPEKRRNKILFINAVSEVTRERAQSFLTIKNIERITKAYEQFQDEPNFTHIASLEEIRNKNGTLSIPLYVATTNTSYIGESRPKTSLPVALDNWIFLRKAVAESLSKILPDIPSLVLDEALNGLGSSALFDRSKWQQVRFGDIVENVNETCEPNKEGIERFIGLEHLESGSLHVLSWGNVANGTTFRRRCRPKQVLFGKRRAYQRKIAVAEFDAVVSGDIYVLAPKDGRLLPELLPLLCTSERFFQYAVETSAGSLSPRTNWGHLSNYELALPPLDQQRRIAKILWAADEIEQRNRELAASARNFIGVEIENELDILFNGPCEKLDDLLLGSPESGCSAPPSSVQTGHYVLSLGALSKQGYVNNNLKQVKPTREMLNASLSKGDFLISRSNTKELVGLVGIFDEERTDISFPDTMMRLPVDERKILKSFLEVVLQSRRGRLHMMRSAAGTSDSMKKINRKTLGSCVVPVPNITVQEQFLARYCVIHTFIINADNSIATAHALRVSLTQSLLEGCL